MPKLSRWLRQKAQFLKLRTNNQKTIPYPIYEGNNIFLGSDYGGWTIIPPFRADQGVVYSFGIGEDASFDLELIANYGVEVHAFDPTPKSIRWVKTQTWPTEFHFHPFGIGGSDKMATFYPPENPDHVSHSILPRSTTAGRAIEVQLYRLKTIAKMLDHEEISILKLDIEGAEYEVIHDLIKTPEVRVQQILVEFHHFFPNISFKETQAAIDGLIGNGYKVFDISKRGYEFGFIRL
jgi:FkbM family methyltransferase